MKFYNKFSIICFGIFVLLMNQNCSKTEFGEVSTEEASQVAEEEPVQEEFVQMDVNSAIELPKISSQIPDCQPNTKCRITFKISKASTMAISFHWKTDDAEVSPWKTGTLPPNVVWGVANIHYTPASGEVLFQPGQTEKIIEIQNINQSASGIRLKVLISQCLLGNGSYRCQLFF